MSDCWDIASMIASSVVPGLPNKCVTPSCASSFVKAVCPLSVGGRGGRSMMLGGEERRCRRTCAKSLSYLRSALGTVARAHEICACRPKAATLVFRQYAIGQYATIRTAIEHVQRSHHTNNRQRDQTDGYRTRRPRQLRRQVQTTGENQQQNADD